MKRFYREVAAAEATGGWQVQLDGRPLRTPAKAALLLESPALAGAIADEWRGQEREIRPETMPLTQLANTAVDLVGPKRGEIVEAVVAYGETDLICYRAERPPDLVRRQHEAWQPLVDWAALRLDAPLTVTAGIMPVPQPPTVSRAFQTAVGALDCWRLAAVQDAAGACGSLVMALALLDGRIDDEAAYAAAVLDESWQIEHWGTDPETTRRLTGLRSSIAADHRFMTLL
ncbi:MAG: ATPase [Azospirillum sp.]|nr:ATPase [Azospirillum sp.]